VHQHADRRVTTSENKMPINHSEGTEIAEVSKSPMPCEAVPQKPPTA
jgi:hypothetical protein